MKKNILLLLYLLVLTVVLIVKEPAFAVEESASAVEESTSSELICQNALMTKLSDEDRDIVSGAIMIAQQLRPSDPQVTLYHIFLAAMTEVRVDGAPITYTNPKLLAFLRERNLLENFQNFLLNNIGLSRDQLGPLFEKNSDGMLILNTDIQFDRNSASDFNNYTPDANRLLAEMTQEKEIDVQETEKTGALLPNDFFINVLKFDNPIRDRLTEPPKFSERSSVQFQSAKSNKMYRGTTQETIPANPIIAFDVINRRIMRSNNYTNPSPYFSIDDPLLYSFFSDLLLDLGRHEEFIRILEQQQTLDDSNRFITLKENDDTYNDTHIMYGKVIGFSEDHTSLVIEGLDGQRYTYIIYRDKDRLYIYREEEELGRLGDAFDSGYRTKDVSVSITSKKLFDIYEEIRGLVGYPIPLNQYTGEPSINLFRELFNSITLNNYLREHYPDLEARQVSLSDFDEDRHLVSFLNSQGERVPGRLIEVNNYNVTIEDLSGHKNVIEGEMLNTISQDKSIRFLFQYPHTDSVDTSEINNLPIVQRQGEGGFSYAELEMSGDPAQDAFRKAVIAGRFEGDERFISFFNEYHGERRLAKIISWKEDVVTLWVYNGKGYINQGRRFILPQFDEEDYFIFLAAAVSQAAKDYFERNEVFLNRGNIKSAEDEDYQFLSRSVPTTIRLDDTAFLEAIDLTDTNLRKWIKKATDIIKEKTGIVPGPQNLTAAQRIQIYRVFDNDIVPLLESPAHGIEYGYFRDLIYTSNFCRLEGDNGRHPLRFLGHILDTKSAVCGELSAFGVVLLSEYGLHAKYMTTSSQMMEMVESEDGHAWIGVQREDGSLEFIDTNGSLVFWSTNLRFLEERYLELSHLSDDELLSLSEEYTLVIPPALPE